MFAPINTLHNRQQNLIGSRLTRSTCMFRLNIDLACVDYANDRSLLDFCALGGDIKFDSASSVLTLRINHSRMDAFGGLYVISNFLENTAIISLPRTNFGQSSQLYDGLLIHHYWQEALQAATLRLVKKLDPQRPLLWEDGTSSALAELDKAKKCAHKKSEHSIT